MKEHLLKTHPFYSRPAEQCVQALLQQYEARAKKSWGQHFLIDDQVYRQIVAACALPAIPPPLPIQVLEIGSGLGTLTACLLATGYPVFGVEREESMCRVLREQLGDVASFTLLEQNALTVDLQPAADATKPTPQWLVVGNLPYHIATPLLFHLLSFRLYVKRMVVMVQKEVADRMVAAPDTSAYGALSVNLQMLAKVWQVADVPAGCFLPPPRVESAVLVLEPYAETRIPVTSVAAFRRVVQTAFSMRRKTLHNALKSMGGTKTDEWLTAAGVDPRCRAETLSLEAFVRLTNTAPTP